MPDDLHILAERYYAHANAPGGDTEQIEALRLEFNQDLGAEKRLAHKNAMRMILSDPLAKRLIGNK